MVLVPEPVLIGSVLAPPKKLFAFPTGKEISLSQVTEPLRNVTTSKNTHLSRKATKTIEDFTQMSLSLLPTTYVGNISLSSLALNTKK